MKTDLKLVHHPVSKHFDYAAASRALSLSISQVSHLLWAAIFEVGTFQHECMPIKFVPPYDDHASQWAAKFEVVNWLIANFIWCNLGCNLYPQLVHIGPGTCPLYSRSNMQARRYLAGNYVHIALLGFTKQSSAVWWSDIKQILH